MPALTDQDLLAAWESGMARRNFASKAVTLLAAAYPESSGTAFAHLQIGERDRRLLALREQVFGKHLAASDVCPGCAFRMEFEFTVQDVTVSLDRSHHAEQAEIIIVDDYQIAFHVPTSFDLNALQDLGDAEDRRKRLLDLVIDEAIWKEVPVTADKLPREIVDELERRLEDIDPQGDVRLNLVCGMCKRQWEALFDIASFFWAEVHAWAIRLMRDVHSLAKAYGWHEAEILALSPWRRQRYLEMLSE